MDWVKILILGVCLVLLIQNVNSSATCVEKFLDGETAETKHVVTVGERVTLRCDVTARDAAKDMVYWKFDDEVMSQDDLVINKYKSKFNVTLEPNFKGTGKDVYTISWIAELDDAGKYNCTCTTGGIQYQVWIKRPCNERQHVIIDASKYNSTTTSKEVLDFLRTNKSKELDIGQSLNISFALDCNCTWPEVNRTFNGEWYTEGPPPKVIPNKGTGQQDASITPIGCYTGKGAVTYRYRNVFGGIDADFTCTCDTCGKEYIFYIDEGQRTIPTTLMKIRCTGKCDQCAECPILHLLITLILTAVITLLCLVGAAVIYSKSQDTELRFTFKALVIIEGLMFIVDIGLLILVQVLCDGKSGPMFLAFYIVLGISLLLAVLTIVICFMYLFGPRKQRATMDIQGRVNGSFRDDKPLIDREKCQKCSKNPVEFCLKPCGHRICSICRKSIQDKRKQQGNNNIVANCPKCARELQATDIEKLCMICWKNPVQCYFKPCQHPAACLSCTKSMLEKSSKGEASLQAHCPECKEEVTDYQTGICLICLKNPVQVSFKPCEHVAACTSCAKSMPAQCPKCKEEVNDYEPVQPV